MLFYNMMHKHLKRCLVNMRSKVLAREWTALQEEIQVFIIYYRDYSKFSLINEFIFGRSKVLINLSYILHVSLIYQAPVDVIKDILNIDAEDLSGILVLLPFDPQNHYSRPKRKICYWFRSKPNRKSYVDVDGIDKANHLASMTKLLPIEIACKQFLSPDIICLLLEHDKTKFTHFKTFADINSKRNLMHYAVTCALCRFRNQNNEPVALDRGKVCISKSSTHLEEESKPAAFISDMATDESFQAYFNLIKYLCKSYPTLILTKDINMYSSIDYVRAIRAQVKRKEGTKFSEVDNVDKIYSHRVECIYKILKHVKRRLEQAMLDDDLRSEYAQCGGSTGYTLCELLEDSPSIPSAVKEFVYRPRTVFV